MLLSCPIVIPLAARRPENPQNKKSVTGRSL
jgi:hypothetical protein